MNHLLIDALSVNNLSGRHVLLGHVRVLHAARSDRWKLSLLTHRDNTDLGQALPADIGHLRAGIGSAWWQRVGWGQLNFDRLARAQGVDLVLSPAGMLSPGCSLPQVVLAQNPLPLMPGARGLRLALQRREFARAQRQAWRMAFNSHYMQELYARRLGPPARAAVVALQGVDEALFAQDCADVHTRAPEILAVSAMAEHKAIEVLVDAFALLAGDRLGLRLVLIGGWPDPSYRQRVEARIRTHGLSERIDLHGHVDEATLRASYRRARAFCLLSRCESFGIPAIEAQVAGTPTVVAEGTAAPEIAGPGGLVVPQDAPSATAGALAALLDDDAAWTRRSMAARRNAERFHWSTCSAPLVALLDRFAAQGTGQ